MVCLHKGRNCCCCFTCEITFFFPAENVRFIFYAHSLTFFIWHHDCYSVLLYMLTIVIRKAEIWLLGDGTGGHWGDRVDCRKKKRLRSSATLFFLQAKINHLSVWYVYGVRMLMYSSTVQYSWHTTTITSSPPVLVSVSWSHKVIFFPWCCKMI